MSTDDDLVPLFIPALVAILAHAEDKKGSALTREEVLDIRNKGACVMVPRSTLPKMAESCGYEDVDPEHCWEEWQVAREQLARYREGQ